MENPIKHNEQLLQPYGYVVGWADGDGNVQYISSMGKERAEKLKLDPEYSVITVYSEESVNKLVSTLQAEIKTKDDDYQLGVIIAEKAVGMVELRKQLDEVNAKLEKACTLLTDLCDTAYIESNEGTIAYDAARSFVLLKS